MTAAGFNICGFYFNQPRIVERAWLTECIWRKFAPRVKCHALIDSVHHDESLKNFFFRSSIMSHFIEVHFSPLRVRSLPKRLAWHERASKEFPKGCPKCCRPCSWQPLSDSDRKRICRCHSNCSQLLRQCCHVVLRRSSPPDLASRYPYQR